MAIREFADSKGVSWRVWNTTPSRAAMYADELREGWLTFESGTELRRLAPIPGSWEEVPADRLELFCRVAAKISDRLSDHDSVTD
jgi:hypothetical protein